MALRFYRRGLTRVRPLLGGLHAWQARNLPLEPQEVGKATAEAPA